MTPEEFIQSKVINDNGYEHHSCEMVAKADALRAIDMARNEKTKAKECLKKLGIEEKLKCEFKPFDKVLVRDLEFRVWYADIFSHINKDDGSYMCIGSSWDECIPYNEQTDHLLGTTENYK
jgi:hypothetical protein